MTTLNKEIHVISVNENGVIYIENEKGTVFGIVDSAKITDADGIPFQQDTLTVIEQNFDCDLEQDWNNETTTIYTDCKGRLVFSGNNVELCEHN